MYIISAAGFDEQLDRIGMSAAHDREQLIIGSQQRGRYLVKHLWLKVIIMIHVGICTLIFSMSHVSISINLDLVPNFDPRGLSRLS